MRWCWLSEKAEDLDVIAAALLALPPGQLKKLLTPEVQAVLERYGKGAGADGVESVP